jgi:C4-dicarboxylate-binding protein DctP
MKGKSLFKMMIVLALVTLMVGLDIKSPTPAGAKETIKLRVGSGHPLATDWILFMSNFYCKETMKRVEQRTNYTLVLEEFWGGSVSKLGSELESVEAGILDIGGIITPFEPAKLFLHNYAYNIPFFPADPKVAARINDKLFKTIPALKDEFKKYNQIYLGSGGVGNYGLISKFPIKATGDVKGRKIAAAGPNLPWISGVGAVPVQSNLPEAYTSLQTGVYDAWVMFATSVAGFKLYEPCKYFVDMNFGATANVLMITINAKAWNKLPKEVQAILKEVGDEFSAKEAEFTEQQTTKAMKTMKDAGTDIYTLPEAEKVKWAKGLINQPKQFAKEADAKGLPGTTLMKAAFKLIEEEGYTVPRKWMEE